MQQLLLVTWTDVFIAPPLDCALYCKECGPQKETLKFDIFGENLKIDAGSDDKL